MCTKTVNNRQHSRYSFFLKAIFIFMISCISGNLAKGNQNHSLNPWELCNLSQNDFPDGAFYYIEGAVNKRCCKCPVGQVVLQDCKQKESATTKCVIDPSIKAPTQMFSNDYASVTRTSLFMTSPTTSNQGGAATKNPSIVHTPFTPSSNNNANPTTENPFKVPNFLVLGWKEILLCVSLTLNVVFILWIRQRDRFTQQIKQEKKNCNNVTESREAVLRESASLSNNRRTDYIEECEGTTTMSRRRKTKFKQAQKYFCAFHQ